MKHVETCLSSRGDRESSFHRCGSPVRLVQPVYVPERPDKSVLSSEEACLTAVEDPESSFYHLGGPVRHVQACLCVGTN